MTDTEDLEEKLDDIDAEIEKLTEQSSGFDFVSEVYRLRAAIVGRKERVEERPSPRLTSRHDRVERIKELQREREQIIRELDERRETTPREPHTEQ